MAKIGDIKQKFGKKHLNNRYIGSRYALMRKIQNSTEKFNGKIRRTCNNSRSNGFIRQCIVLLYEKMAV